MHFIQQKRMLSILWRLFGGVADIFTHRLPVFKTGWQLAQIFQIFLFFGGGFSDIRWEVFVVNH
jgi:hypothetical protein